MMIERRKRLLALALLSGLALAAAGGVFLASQLINSGTAEANSDSCRATCEEGLGQCYRDTADRKQCTKAYKQCLSACVNG